MISTDRITKMLLFAIVVLLAILVFRPMISLTPSATAADGEEDIELGYLIRKPSVIPVPKGDYVREMQIVDSAQAFIVRYDNRIEVYRIRIVSVDPDRLRKRSSQPR